MKKLVEGMGVEIWDSEVLKELELRKLFMVDAQIEIFDIAPDLAYIEAKRVAWCELAKAREEAKLAERTGCIYCPHSEFSFNFVTCTLAIGERLLSDEEDSIARNGGVPDWCPLVEEEKFQAGTIKPSPPSPTPATQDTA